MSTKINLTEKDIARFWSKVSRGATDACWEWRASRNGQGYGEFGLRDRNVKAHRVSYVIANGSIQDDLDVLHTCDNPPCCNPAHLFQGTHTDNMQDMLHKGRHGLKSHPERAARGERHGIHTHIESRPRGEKNGNAKLTIEQVAQIRELRKQGVLQRVLATMFGVSVSEISLIDRGEHWKQ